jgi:FKBP-type peptidyl-prolyl cis-trans isomerase FklB
MKTILSLTIAGVCLSSGSVAFSQEAERDRTQANDLLQHMETLLSETNRVSYAIGVNLARNLKANFPQFHREFFLLGLQDVLDENRLKLSEDEINRSIARYTEVSNEHVKKEFNDFKQDNLETAERWLELNAKREGVNVITNGLQYRVLSPGATNAPKPNPEGHALVHYHGTGFNGRMVDSTLVGDTKGPVPISLKEPPLWFWREILPLMPIGSKWEVYVHPKYAYGGIGSKTVYPNELLRYSVEIAGFQ